MAEGHKNFEDRLKGFFGADSLPDFAKDAIKNAIKEAIEESLKDAANAATESIKNAATAATAELRKVANEYLGKGSGFAAAWNSFWEKVDVLISPSEPDDLKIEKNEGESDKDYVERVRKINEIIVKRKSADKAEYFKFLFKKYFEGYIKYDSLSRVLEAEVNNAKDEQRRIMEERDVNVKKLSDVKKRVDYLENRVKSLEKFKEMQAKFQKDLNAKKREANDLESKTKLPERYEELKKILDKKEDELKVAKKKSKYYKEQSEKAAYHFIKLKDKQYKTAAEAAEAAEAAKAAEEKAEEAAE